MDIVVRKILMRYVVVILAYCAFPTVHGLIKTQNCTGEKQTKAIPLGN